MIPIEVAANHFKLLLHLLSMLDPVPSDGQFGGGHKKATDFFNSAVNGLDQKPLRNVSLDHSVKVIKSLISNHYNNDFKTNQPNNAKESTSDRLIENPHTKPFKNDAIPARFIQSAIAQLSDMSSHGCENYEQITLVCHSPQPMIKEGELDDNDPNRPSLRNNANEMNPAVGYSTIEETQTSDHIIANDSGSDDSESKRQSVIRNDAIFLKPAKERLIAVPEGNVPKERFERIAVKESSIPTPRDSTASFQSNLRIGEMRKSFQPASSDPISNNPAAQSIRESTLSVKLIPLPILNTTEPLNFCVPIAIPIGVSRSQARVVHEASVVSLTDVKVIPAALPFPGMSLNSSFLTAKRKKEKKKQPDEEDREEKVARDDFLYF
jgi:hypothetical protein